MTFFLPTRDLCSLSVCACNPHSQTERYYLVNDYLMSLLIAVTSFSFSIFKKAHELKKRDQKHSCSENECLIE